MIIVLFIAIAWAVTAIVTAAGGNQPPL
jgi:hypothetical protein